MGDGHRRAPAAPYSIFQSRRIFSRPTPASASAPRAGPFALVKPLGCGQSGHTEEERSSRAEIMIPRCIVWPLFALVMGFALGGSIFWGAFGPNVTNENLDHPVARNIEAVRSTTKEDNDAALARYTLWLAILTGGLVVVSAGQGFFLLRADKTARITAESAQAQTKNFEKLERPYVYVFYPEGLELESNREDPFYYVKYRVANYGKTPATIEAVFADVSVGKFPAEPREVRGWDSLLRIPIMTPNEKPRDQTVIIPETIAIGEYADADTPPVPEPHLTGDDEFYVRVIIKYRGPFSRRHETSACWRWESLRLMSSFVWKPSRRA
jgi:hypothetical protein